MTRSSVRASHAIAASLALLAACTDAPTARSEELFGRWEKVEKSMPPITLEIRRESTGPVGQVWLSGVTYTLPATVDDSSVTLARPESSTLAPVYGVLLPDGRLRVVLRGTPDYEATLVRR
jgi:hypothetical protein